MEKPHRELDVWQVAMELVADVYRATARFPDAEQYGLVSQARRSAASVPSNIAEGAGRSSSKELVRFCRMAQASLSELDTHVETARRLGYLDPERFDELDGRMVRIDKMLTGLIESVEAESG